MQKELNNEQLMLARGRFSTIRAAHEDEKKRLQKLCGELASYAPQILRQMQPDDDGVPDMKAIMVLIMGARVATDKIEECIAKIEELATQRAEMKGEAWPK